ncbi:unnamed protein product [Ascophyllum nodosum]
MYYRGAGAAIVVYDITKMNSSRTLKEWINELQAQGPQDIAIAIAGNKRDLESERVSPPFLACVPPAWGEHSLTVFCEARNLSKYNVPLLSPCNQRFAESCVARAYAEEIGAMFVETSAKTDTQVQDVFVELSKRLPKRQPAQSAADTLHLDSAGGASSMCY